eukprot:1159221-Pelagomonas_calceolata.AAC.7
MQPHCTSTRGCMKRLTRVLNYIHASSTGTDRCRPQKLCRAYTSRQAGAHGRVNSPTADI